MKNVVVFDPLYKTRVIDEKRLRRTRLLLERSQLLGQLRHVREEIEDLERDIIDFNKSMSGSNK